MPQKIDFTIKDKHKFDAMDTALMSNFLDQSTKDIEQTDKRLIRDKAEGESEANPLVRPIIEKAPDAFKPLGFVGQAGLVDRWTNEQDEKKRKQEMLLANLVEAGALAYSKQPWQLKFGFNF